MSPEQPNERPYQDFTELDLYETLHELQKGYVEADRERDRIIQAYHGMATVLEDEDYQSASETRKLYEDEIRQINHEREYRRQDNRRHRLSTSLDQSSSDHRYTS